MKLAPSPNSHDQDVTMPVVALENATVSGAVPEVGDSVKAATGDGVDGSGAGAGTGVGDPIDVGVVKLSSFE